MSEPEGPTLGAATTPSVGGGPPVAEDISGATVRRGDRVFRGLVGASATVLVIMAAIAVFLIYRAIPALRANTVNFFTTSSGCRTPDPAASASRRCSSARWSPRSSR